MLALLLSVLVASLVPARTATAAEQGPTPAPTTVMLFYGDGCPHCAAEEAFLTSLVDRNPHVVVDAYEVWNDPAGQERLMSTARRLGFDPYGVPVTVIGERVWIGFDDATAAEIEAQVTGLHRPGSVPTVDAADTVDIPLIGQIDAGQASLIATTLAIGFVDGINPCSLWVLSLLLAMVVSRLAHTHRARGRVLGVGAVFLAITAAMYGLYVFGFYSAASYLSAMGWLRVAVAVIAGTFGVLQWKDGLGLSWGPSLSMSASRRPGLYARMRTIASPDRAFGTTLVATGALAVAVSLLETPCTAGLPLLWTTLLADQGVQGAQAIGLFLLYLLVFLLDEVLLFGAAVITLRATRVQERHGRLLKLIAGSMLVVLAASMLMAPEALTTITGVLVVFSASAALTIALYASSAWMGRRSSPGNAGSSASAGCSRSGTTSRTTE